MKVFCTTLLSLFFCFSLHSQSSIWGTVKKGGQHDYGYLYKTNATGDNRVIIHQFDSVHGKTPGPVIQASNGKLYGMTAQGGQGVVQIGLNYTQGGTLFEYDPVIDSFRTLVHFNSGDPFYPQKIYGPSDLKLLEVSPGILWAVLTMRQNNNGVIQILNEHIISYNIVTGAMANIATVPSWTTPLMALPRHTSLSTELYMASDGYIYSTTSGYSSCATTTDATNGSIVRIDPATNVISYIRPFPCNYSDGLMPQGNFTEVNGKFYSTTLYGGPNVTIPTFLGYGLLYEYDPITTTYTRKFDLPGGANGGNPMGYQLKAPNGKLYGATARGTVSTYYPHGSGTIYEYDVVTNTHTKKADFSPFSINLNLGSLWLCSSNGNLYGTYSNGIFEYNIATNQIREAASLITYYANPQPNPIIEVCQKPAYHYNTVAAYTVCAGSPFSIDLQSPNTQSYIWKHNGIVSAGHTTGSLAFNPVALSDAGTWICEMTNACGTTTAQALSITVNPAGTGVLTSTISAAGSTSICPGSSLVLSGNVNGVWNTGATVPSIQVSMPGIYHVVNTNACGNTYSNIIRIDTIATPQPSVISSGSGPTPHICQGDSVFIFGNTNGIWNTGETTPGIYIKDNQPHYVISSTACKTVQSNTIQAAFIVPPVSPSVTAVGSLTICTGDSLLLDASGTASYNWYKFNGVFQNYVSHGNQIYVKQSGTYFIKISYMCGSVTSQSIEVVAGGTALGPAAITPLGSTVICQGDGVVLQSNYASCTWNTGATTQTILATGSGPYTVTNYNSCSSVTSPPFTLSVTPAPVTSFSQTQNMLCFTTGSITLSAGTPSGGYYSGNGISGNTFDPLLAGAGTHTVSYNYQDPVTGCTGKSTQQIIVEGDPVVTAAPSTVICQGSSTVLFQDSPSGIWNSTGQAALFLLVTQPGSYYVSRPNSCGVTVTSNTLQVAANPSPTVTISGISDICSGNSVTLTGSGGISYTWTPGGGTPSIQISPVATTSYTLAAEGSNGCIGYAVKTVTVYALPSIVVTNTTVCSGNQVSLSASGANTYTWSTSQTGPAISVAPSVNTIYQVTGTDHHSCVNNTTVSVVVHSLPPVPVVSITGQGLISSPAVSYQWYLNGGIIPGATSQTYAPVQNGDYTVVIYDQNGCSSVSLIHTVIDTGIGAPPAGNDSIEVYPNPSTGTFTIHTPFIEYEIRVVNGLGQVVVEGTRSFTSDFTLQQNGIYMIHLRVKSRTYTKKLLITGN